MADDAIVFAMANPTPEIMPEELPPGKVAVVATGRSDYPNQINNVLAFPGVFRGALDVRASDDQRGDEARGRRRDRVGGRARRARPGVHHPERVQPRRGAGGGARRSPRRPSGTVSRGDTQAETQALRLTAWVGSWWCLASARHN